MILRNFVIFSLNVVTFPHSFQRSKTAYGDLLYQKTFVGLKKNNIYLSIQETEQNHETTEIPNKHVKIK